MTWKYKVKNELEKGNLIRNSTYKKSADNECLSLGFGAFSYDERRYLHGKKYGSSEELDKNGISWVPHSVAPKLGQLHLAIAVILAPW